ncbi:MAG: iron ABC transporter [Candidatus Roseilinea sp.]|uniref:FecCD family ABC transporter permease n=1 Tax=Candidatus Roseilinea sp. NK_OTU-006 TaxID=2704250 RepID=UPI0021FE85D7|nr:iron ABC transporter permease [Candidatus Roseilinea sp. NK_OTU-006]BCX02723.1 MAG: iron ABC transporter [Candidatus Roseilinea sp.]
MNPVARLSSTSTGQAAPSGLTGATVATNAAESFPPLGIRRGVLLGLAVFAVAAFLLSLAVGSVPIPLDEVVRVLLGVQASKDTWQTIVLVFRLPKAITALLAGAALSVAGLQMQTLFRNPLADPFALGISSGASLGVALAVLGGAAASVSVFGRAAYLGDFGLVTAASLGAAAVFALVLAIARRVQSVITLLVLGLMISYLAGAVVSVLIYFSIPEQVSAYLNWTFGSFGGVTWQQMRAFAPTLLLGLAAALFTAKPLNALLLGENYAASMGINVRAARWWVTASASLLAGAVTAFCGPIGFIGIAVPHLCRALFGSSDHRVLLPAALMLGGGLALIFDLISQMPGARAALPLNVVTSAVGAPVVLWIVLRRQSFGRV